jgi:hypothetical protein
MRNRIIQVCSSFVFELIESLHVVLGSNDGGCVYPVIHQRDASSWHHVAPGTKEEASGPGRGLVRQLLQRDFGSVRFTVPFIGYCHLCTGCVLFDDRS